MKRKLILQIALIVFTGSAWAGDFLDFSEDTEKPQQPTPSRPSVTQPAAPAPAAPKAPQQTTEKFKCLQKTNDKAAIIEMIEDVTQISEPWGRTLRSAGGDTFTLVTRKGVPHAAVTGSFTLDIDIKLCREGNIIRGDVYGGSYRLVIEPGSLGRSVYITNSADNKRVLFSLTTK